MLAELCSVTGLKHGFRACFTQNQSQATGPAAFLQLLQFLAFKAFHESDEGPDHPPEPLGIDPTPGKAEAFRANRHFRMTWVRRKNRSSDPPYFP
jgi:hypothetical protein